MTIASPAFFFAFLPACLVIYWWVLRRPRARLWCLCGASYLFYALAGWRFLPVLLGMSWLTYWAAHRKWFTPAIVLNLLVLGLFKYWDWGAANTNNLAGALGLPAMIPLLRLALPLGLSFYTFKHIGYLVDVRTGAAPASSDFLTFNTFSAFFPQISAGPISSFRDTGAQLRTLAQKIDSAILYDALVHIAYGLAKKVLIGDVLLQAVTAGASKGSGLVESWIFLATFGVQVYFDFSGYSDIVLGIAMLFGVRLPPNFNNPLRLRNIQDFWQRWHISLSAWFRAYLFFPLSRFLLRRLGSYHPRVVRLIANIVTMSLVGLWHAASWGFVTWGLLMGLLLSLENPGSRAKTRPPWQRVTLDIIIRLLMLSSVALIITTGSLSGPTLFRSLVGLNGLGSFEWLLSTGFRAALPALVIAWMVALSGYGEAANLVQFRGKGYAIAWSILLVLAWMLMGSGVDFLYVQF